MAFSKLFLTSLLFSLLLLLPSKAQATDFLIAPYLQYPSSSSMTLVWEQDDQDHLMTVRYGEGNFADYQQALPQDSNLFRLTLEELSPNTRYSYSFEMDGEILLESFFWTAPAPGDVESPFHFLAMGDTRSNHVAHTTVIEAMSAVDNVRFYLHSGDMVSSGSVREQWRTFFEIEAPILSHAPIIPSTSNHDVSRGNSWFFDDYFAEPGEEVYYSISYGPILLLSLDGYVNASSGNRFSTQQMEWIEGELQRSVLMVGREYTIILVHVGPFGASEGRSGNAQMRELLDLFDLYEVNLILSGHDHTYMRNRAENGIWCITSAGGGAHLYGATCRNYPCYRDGYTTFFSQAIYHFMLFEYQEGMLEAEVFDTEGTMIDQFFISNE